MMTDDGCTDRWIDGQIDGLTEREREKEREREMRRKDDVFVAFFANELRMRLQIFPHFSSSSLAAFFLKDCLHVRFHCPV
jgi:hypothetical protein